MKCISNTDNTNNSFAGVVTTSSLEIRTKLHNEAYELDPLEIEKIPSYWRGMRISSGFHPKYYVEVVEIFTPGSRVILKNPVLVYIAPPKMSFFRLCFDFFIRRKFSLNEKELRSIVGDILLRGDCITYFE